MFRVDFDTDTTDAWFDGMVADANAAVRPAAQAAAQALYDEARIRVPVGDVRVGKGGKVYTGGTLQTAIYQAFSADNSTATRAVYHVSWNASKAPHGHLVEFGHWQPYRVVRYTNGRFVTLKGEKLDSPRWTPAHSFIRASHDAKAAAALEAAQAEFVRRMRGGS
jgi:hypothetical protein